MKNKIKEISDDIDFIKQKLFETTSVPNTFFKYNEYPLHNYNISNPCINCPNNPKNNPHLGGFCNCALPALMNPIY